MFLSFRIYNSDLFRIVFEMLLLCCVCVLFANHRVILRQQQVHAMLFLTEIHTIKSQFMLQLLFLDIVVIFMNIICFTFSTVDFFRKKIGVWIKFDITSKKWEILFMDLINFPSYRSLIVDWINEMINSWHITQKARQMHVICYAFFVYLYCSLTHIYLGKAIANQKSAFDMSTLLIWEKIIMK